MIKKGRNRRKRRRQATKKRRKERVKKKEAKGRAKERKQTIITRVFVNALQKTAIFFLMTSAVCGRPLK